jgi:uncharacterized repeat protein (TIGR03803 family)
MLGKTSPGKRCTLLALLVFGLLLGAARAQTETVLYSFCTQGGSSCTDGNAPVASVVLDHEGNLYGTTPSGGAYRGGVVFSLTPGGQETVLYSFCAQSNCTDGWGPVAGVIFDPKGNLYGTTSDGGLYYDACDGYGCGAVFKLTPAGQETVLDSFAGYYGYDPVAGVVFDQKGNLYGTTHSGGDYGGGVVFKLTPKGKEIVLYSFCAQGGYHCTDGTNPNAGLVFDQRGNLYGTTYLGGDGVGCESYGCGVVFKLTPEGKETVLHSFCEQGDCTDGNGPVAGVVLDQEGNVYGTTVHGGDYGYDVCPSGCGVAFKITPKGKETVLHTFCAKTNCVDGANPSAALVFDGRGSLYGTTAIGGAYTSNWCYYGCGVVFKLNRKGKETVLYSFCAQTNCTDGATPDAGLTLDQKGNLYGTTQYGGAYNPNVCSDMYGYYGCGAVFKLTP